MFLDHSEDVIELNEDQVLVLERIVAHFKAALAGSSGTEALANRGFTATTESLESGYLQVSNPSKVQVDSGWVTIEPLGLVKRGTRSGAKPAPDRVDPAQVRLAVILWQAPNWLLRLCFANSAAQPSKAKKAQNREKIKQKKKKKKKKRPNRYIWKSFTSLVSGGLPGLGKRR